MRNLTLHMYTTLDGHAEFPSYPGSDTVLTKADPAFQEMWVDRYDEVDTLLFGRRAFDDHARFWPESNRTKADPKFVWEFARWKDKVQKIVFSKSMPDPTWQNSRVIRGDISRAVAKLKREPGKDMILEGGPTIAQEFLRRRLIDDYRLVVFPVLLGHGKNWFGQMLKQQNMKLLSAKTLRDGELVLHYKMVH
jgi:dihydrofolate reductase